jgi:threonine dehydratase
MQHGKLVVEGAGAVSVAALLSGAVKLEQGAPAVAILSGGNIDLDRLSAASRLHEASQGTTIHIATNVPDHPGGLAGLLVAIAEAQGNVLSVEHLRDAGQRGFHETGIEVVLQTRGAEHRDALMAALAEHGYDIAILAADAS